MCISLIKNLALLFRKKLKDESCSSNPRNIFYSSVLENGTLRPPVNIAAGKSTYQSSVYSRAVHVGSATSSLAVGEGKTSPI